MAKRKEFLIVGLGGFGFALAKAISKRGGVVFAVDKEERLVEEIKDFVEVAARLDATDYKALKSFGVENIDIAIVCIGAVEENLLTTILLKKLGVPKIFSRAVSPLQKEILKALEVTRIIEVEQEFADAFALSLVEKDVFKQISLSEGYSVVELKVPEFFVGKRLKELDLRRKYK
ncbi:MAG: TrkA family potassium uptake protein, partial [Caldiserica bacterium]